MHDQLISFVLLFVLAFQIESAYTFFESVCRFILFFYTSFFSAHQETDTELLQAEFPAFVVSGDAI